MNLSITTTHMSKIAGQVVARVNILLKLDSTCLAEVPTSATLIANRGFPALIATVSAVDVLPTPGGPGLKSALHH